ncbi:hypothetical protein BV22DRAFT_1027281, partial [Leucogyrophana mollusca]
MDFNDVDDFPSHYQVKKLITELTGIEPIICDCCINTCIGYTGPFSQLDHCPTCGEARYDQEKLLETGGKVKVPRKRFPTICLGPQLQAMYRDPEKARDMHYRRERTQEIFNELDDNEGIKQAYNDFLDGSDYLEAVADGRIKDEDIVVMFSIDGAQLYRNKESDCWMSIWIIFERSPDSRYKKKYVLPGVIIPGPNKPKNLDSFLFPGFHHLAAIQKEGLPIWDAS